MKIISMRIMRGPNYWSVRKPRLVVLVLDPGPHAGMPRADVMTLLDRLTRRFPMLAKNMRAPASLERSTVSSALGRLVAGVALELQAMAGMSADHGAAWATGNKGECGVVFAYTLERAGILAAEAAVRIVDSALSNKIFGFSRDVGEMEALRHAAGGETPVPDRTGGSIPVIAVTGTNGKTTTTRIIARLFRQCGRRVGHAMTDGVWIDGRQVEEGDCAGPRSARRVLEDPAVEIAVLETARGGLLRAGLGFSACDMGIVTNVSADHLGIGGIRNLEQMARLKAVVPKSVRPGGHAVLNADDDRVYQMGRRLAADVALFSLDGGNPRILEHRRHGGACAMCEGGWFVLCRGSEKHPVARVEDVPLTMNGRAVYMVRNILPAILAAWLGGVGIADIAAALHDFAPSVSLTPGRLNQFSFKEFSVLVDFAHNTAGFQALAEVVAFMITLFSVASLCMSYIIVHKFALVFGLSNGNAHALALGIVVVTSVYVLVGGFEGVIFSEFLQTVVLFAVAFIVGFVCYKQYSADQIHASVTHGADAAAVTPAYWKSLMPEARPRIGMFSASEGYKGWQDFIGATLAFSIVGMIGCVGGAGGRYGEQRFLAATNVKEAAKLAALWQFLGFPRWIMTAGLCYLGYALYTKEIAHDPECVMPKFLQSGLLGPGLLGLVIAGLSASFMTSFCSEINACASIIVRDLYQPLVAPQVADSDRKLVRVGYIVTGCLALLAAMIGYAMVESQARGGGSALNVIWGWMLGGLLTCFVVPLAFRWYWGRMNGWGFAAGCLCSLVPSLAMLVRAFVPDGDFLKAWPENYYTYATLATSTLACIVVSFLTPPIEDETTMVFYAKVRPFGFWKNAAAKAKQANLKMATAIPVPQIVLNVALGLVASFSLYMAPVYFLGHWNLEGTGCTAIFAICCVALYFTWYRTLPDD